MTPEEFDALVADKRYEIVGYEAGLTWTKKEFGFKPADKCPNCAEYQFFAHELKKSKRGKKTRNIRQLCHHCDYLVDHAENIPAHPDR